MGGGGSPSSACSGSVSIPALPAEVVAQWGSEAVARERERERSDASRILKADDAQGREREGLASCPAAIRLQNRLGYTRCNQQEQRTIHLHSLPLRGQFSLSLSRSRSRSLSSLQLNTRSNLPTLTQLRLALTLCTPSHRPPRRQSQASLRRRRRGRQDLPLDRLLKASIPYSTRF